MSTSLTSTEPAQRDLIVSWFHDQRWTADAYLALSATSSHLLELSDGKLTILPMPTLSHQRAVKRFVDAATQWLAGSPGGEVVFAPHPIRLWPGKFREPDAMVYLGEHTSRMGEQASGVPDVAIEVHSPGTTRLDLVEKFGEYAEAGIAEYWMVDLAARRVSVFALEGSTYRLVGHHGPGEHATSRMMTGFSIATDDLAPS